MGSHYFNRAFDHPPQHLQTLASRWHFCFYFGIFDHPGPAEETEHLKSINQVVRWRWEDKIRMWQVFAQSPGRNTVHPRKLVWPPQGTDRLGAKIPYQASWEPTALCPTSRHLKGQTSHRKAKHSRRSGTHDILQAHYGVIEGYARITCLNKEKQFMLCIHLPTVMDYRRNSMLLAE
jgi:hypothetical protein